MYAEDRMKDYSKWETNISRVLSRYGIDALKDFTVNGMKFSRNENGILVSQRESDAKLAYEMQALKNLTYEFADEDTKKLIQYRSNYYLKSVSEQVKEVWEKTLQETGVNPFVENYSNTISQLAMEQDFATGGNDQLFDSTVESAIEATKRIFERIDNQLEAVNEERREGMEKEKGFLFVQLCFGIDWMVTFYLQILTAYPLDGHAVKKCVNIIIHKANEKIFDGKRTRPKQD